MKLYVFLAALVALVVITECGHTFVGTNVQRKQVLNRNVKYDSYMFQKRVEKVRINLPAKYGGQSFQGFLAYDKLNSEASVNITEGGLGYNYIQLRLKSERGRGLDYQLYAYI